MQNTLSNPDVQLLCRYWVMKIQPDKKMKLDFHNYQLKVFGWFFLVWLNLTLDQCSILLVMMNCIRVSLRSENKCVKNVTLMVLCKLALIRPQI